MPNRLSKLFSSSEAKEKEALDESERNRSNDSPPPPGYDEQAPNYDRENILEPPDITAGFSNLKISANRKDGFPQPAEAIAHLKVLECFYRLKQSVGSHDGLFGIDDKVVTGHGIPESDKTAQLLSKLAEKRWAIYLQRAVDRFETWWAAVTPNARMITRSQLELDGKNDTLLRPSRLQGQEIRFNATNMPPADVLMVWHSYMLNPRNYLEDCIRYGRLAMWHTPMPWQVAMQCINSETFAYEATPEAVQSFESLTGLPWDNLQDRNSKRVHCPLCNERLWAAWTESPSHAPPGQVNHESVLEGLIDEMLSSGLGYCDKNFRLGCTGCKGIISHERLRFGKFVNDVKMLIQDDVPLPGTVLGHEGMPYMAFGKKDITSDPVTRIANDLFKQGLGQIMINDHMKNRDGPKTIGDIRDAVEEVMTDRKYMRKARGSHAHRMQRYERIAIRKIMSRYWENSSPFSLDLVGAVIRQGSFIEKMHGIDWLHSPALPSTMTRLIAKYATFIQIMASTPMRMAVPTLDVDLAWHTHQLSPYKYMQFTVLKTSQFIDHDDKVAETKLNDAFAWTSKTYQKITGHPYSECTCWYCEAIRESHTSTTSRLFNGSSSRAKDNLHSAPQDPKKSIHISAHNAIRPRDDAVDPIYSNESKARAEQLEKHYLKACERAKKKGKPVPKRDDYYYSDAWGYPVYIPAYSPYVGFVPYAPMYYPVTPGCMAVGAGAVGNCCSGTCGAGVAAGGCGGAGGCAGGAAGGCGGGGGGGCGGGGGGGCGGGGGGGGCGGGGGGG